MENEWDLEELNNGENWNSAINHDNQHLGAKPKYVPGRFHKISSWAKTNYPFWDDETEVLVTFTDNGNESGRLLFYSF